MAPALPDADAPRCGACEDDELIDGAAAGSGAAAGCGADTAGGSERMEVEPADAYVDSEHEHEYVGRAVGQGGSRGVGGDAEEAGGGAAASSGAVACGSAAAGGGAAVSSAARR